MVFKIIGNVVRDKDAVSNDILKTLNFPEGTKTRMQEQLKTELKLIDAITAMECIYCDGCNKKTNCNIHKLVLNQTYLPYVCRIRFNRIYEKVDEYYSSH